MHLLILRAKKRKQELFRSSCTYAARSSMCFICIEKVFVLQWILPRYICHFGYQLSIPPYLISCWTFFFANDLLLDYEMPKLGRREIQTEYLCLDHISTNKLILKTQASRRPWHVCYAIIFFIRSREITV
jgi:hypothetical protein